MIINIPAIPGDEASTLSWMLRGFFGGVCQLYSPNAPRREEAYKLVVNILLNARESGVITAEQFNAIHSELTEFYCYEFLKPALEV